MGEETAKEALNKKNTKYSSNTEIRKTAYKKREEDVKTKDTN